MFDPTVLIPDLRQQLNSILTTAEEQLKGLTDLSATPLSAESLSQVDSAAAARAKMKQLILTVLTDLDQLSADWAALEAVGFPTLPPIPVVDTVFQELQAELVALETAVGLFPQGSPETVTFIPSTATKES